LSSVRRSFLLSLADSYLGVVLQLASTIMIARLLTPAEVGTFAIAAVFAALASTFRDFGVAEYLIQARSLTPAKLRAALALNIIVSWAIAALLAVLAPFAADFYREPGVGYVMWVQALNFMLVPFGAVTQAWFRRELNYRPIVIGNLLSSIAAFVVAVSLAYAGFGFMSLAWSSLAGIVVTVVVAMWFRPADFPKWPALAGIGEVFQFGKFASSIYIVGQLGKGAPELLIGRALGTAPVGIYSRAGGLVEMFNRLVLRPVFQVCMPYFAKSDRESGTLVPAYLHSVGLLTAVGWPLLALLGVLAYPAIRLIYGDQWLAAVTLAQILCAAAAVELLQTLSREALLAKGQARRANALQIQLVLLQVSGLTLVFPYGLTGAAWGWMAGNLIGLVVAQWHLDRGIGLALGALSRAVVPSAVMTAVTAGPLLLVAQIWPIVEGNYLRWGFLGGSGGLLLWLLAARALRHPLWDEISGLSKRLFQKLRAR
jgi:O-antigen/teichoic acid export membrane protein